MPVAYETRQTGLGFDTRQMWSAVRRHRGLFCGCFFAVLITGGSILSMLTPAYTAVATVAISSPNADPLAPIGQVQASPPADDNLPATIASMMQSREVAAAVLAELPPPRVKVKTKLAKVLCDVRLNLGCGPVAFADPLLEQQAEIDGFLKMLSITPEMHSSVINVSVTAKTGLRAEALADAAVRNYQHIALQQQSAQSDRVSNWLRLRTLDLQREWLTAVQVAELYRVANHIGDTGDETSGVPLVNQQISDASAGLDLAQSRLLNAEADADGGSAVAVTQQPLLAGAASMLMQLQSSRDQLAGEFGANYPKVKALDRQIAASGAMANRERSEVLAGGRKTTIADRAQVKALTARLDELSAQALAATVVQANYLTLKAEAESAHTAYATFVEHAAEVADRATLLEPPVSVISDAGLPLLPSFPDKPRFAVGIMFLALVAGAGAVLIKESLSENVVEGEPPGFNMEVPLLATLPFVPARRNRVISNHIFDDPYSRTSESMRGIVASLSLLPSNHAGGRSVLVTSAQAQEGKTTFAGWLASTVAQSGKNTLLINGDHRQSISKHHSSDQITLGLTDFIFGNATVKQIIQSDPRTKIDRVTAGSISVGHFGSVEITKLRDMLSILKRSYSLIIFDSPPLLVAPEGFIYGTVTDETVFICRWQHTSPRAVTTSIDRLRAGSADVSGIVVSMVNKNSPLAFDGEYSQHELALITRLYGT